MAPKTDAKLRGVSTVQATCPSSIGYVLFRVDDKFVYAWAPPYKMRWDTSSVTDGTHVLSIDAFDTQAKFQGSSSIRVEVKNSIDAPSGGVLLAVRFGGEDMVIRSVSAHGELATLGDGETLPPGCAQVTGSLSESLGQTVMDPFYQGNSVLLRNRIKDGWLSANNTRTSLTAVGEYAMVQVSRNGLTIPQLTSVHTTRIAPGELSLALPDYPVLTGDTWQSPIAVMPVVYAKRTFYVQAQHTFEGLRWYMDQECAVITSTFTLPGIQLFGPTTGAKAPQYGVSLAQARGSDNGSMMAIRMRMMRSGVPGEPPGAVPGRPAE